MQSAIRVPLSAVSKLALAAAAVAVMPAFASAATVTLTTSNAAGSTSFNTATGWSDGQAPSAANDYLVDGGRSLRTPFDTANIAFAGNSLTLGASGSGVLVLKNANNATVTVNNVTLNLGIIQNGGTSTGAATALTFAGSGITLGAGGGTLDSGTGGRSINVSAPVSGAGNLSVVNGGIITLSGANGYAGTTTVGTGATLAAVDGVGLSTASALVLGGGSLSTSGAFTRALGTSAGQVSVTGAAGFTAIGGDLVVALGGTATPTPLTVGSGGFAPTTLFLNNGSGVGTVDFRNGIDLAGSATFGVNVTNATTATAATLSGNITDSVGNGTFTKAGAGLLILTGTNTYTGPTVVSGLLRANEGTSLPTVSNLTLNGGVLETSSNVTRSVGTGAGQIQFNNANSGGFSAVGGNVTVALGGTASPTPLAFGTAAGNIGTGTLILGSANQAGFTLTLANDLDLSTAAATTTRTVISQGGTTVINGVISNTGAAQGVLGIEGNGTAAGGVVVLAGANTYGGSTQVDTGAQGSGTARAVNNLSFGTSVVTIGPGGNATNARLEVANNVTLANNINLLARANTTVALQNLGDTNTIAGTLSLFTGGSNYIIQSDNGLLTLSGANGSTPGTAITAGTAVTGTRVVTLQGAGNGRVTGLITNSGATVGLTKAGSGTWTLTAANTFTGAITINAGTLQLGDGTGGNDGTIATTSGVTNNGTLAYNRSGTSTATYVISGTGAVVKSGAGTQILTGANTYTGTTTVNAGSLEFAPAAQSPVLANAGGADIRNGQIKLDYTGTSIAGTVRGLLAASFMDATTPGVMETGQLRSSTATATRGLGYRDDGTGIVVKATLFGDADLDGGVSINDFNALAGNFGQSGKVWVDGDFDYDGGVSINDFNLLAGSFGQSLPATSEAWTGLLAFAAAHNDLAAFEAVTGVPEPTSLALLAAGATLGLRRRRQA